jgi:hypothetical protein
MAILSARPFAVAGFGFGVDVGAGVRTDCFLAAVRFAIDAVLRALVARRMKHIRRESFLQALPDARRDNRWLWLDYVHAAFHMHVAEFLLKTNARGVCDENR